MTSRGHSASVQALVQPVGAALAALVVLASTAHARDLRKNLSAKETSVLARSRPLYDPICLNPAFGDARAGSPILICPSVDFRLGFEDNVFRTAEAGQSDLYYGVRPTLTVRADWPNNTLTAGVQADITRYAELSTNDYTDYSAYVSGRSDVSEATSLSAEVSRSRDHEDRGDPNSPPGVVDVNVFDVTAAELRGEYQPSDIFFTAEVGAERYNYKDNGPIDNDDRDRIEYNGRLRLGYRLGQTSAAPRPEKVAYVQTAVNVRDFDRDRDRFGFEQDSVGYAASVGFLYDISALVFLDVSAGWFQRRYAESRYDTTQGFQAALDLTWNATDLLTVDASLGRSVEEVATVAGSSGFLVTQGDLQMAYEIDYDWVARVGVSLARVQFQGFSRRDTDIGMRLGVTHFVNAYLSVEARLQRRQRQSTLPAAAYTAHRGVLTLEVQY